MGWYAVVLFRAIAGIHVGVEGRDGGFTVWVAGKVNKFVLSGWLAEVDSCVRIANAELRRVPDIRPTARQLWRRECTSRGEFWCTLAVTRFTSDCTDHARTPGGSFGSRCLPLPQRNVGKNGSI